MMRFTFLLRPCHDDGLEIIFSTATVVARDERDARRKLESSGYDVGGLWKVGLA